MPNQIPRRQILQNPAQVEGTNMRKNSDRPFGMSEYDIPMPTQRPMGVQDRDPRSMPSSPSTTSQIQVQPSQQATPSQQAVPSPQTTPSIDLAGTQIGIPVFDPEFTQGYLRQNIGAKVKVEFLIGTNMLIDREGTLVDVGISYIIIVETETDDLLLCDIYSIKFVRFYG